MEVSALNKIFVQHGNPCYHSNLESVHRCLWKLSFGFSHISLQFFFHKLYKVFKHQGFYFNHRRHNADTFLEVRRGYDDQHTASKEREKSKILGKGENFTSTVYKHRNQHPSDHPCFVDTTKALFLLTLAGKSDEGQRFYYERRKMS